MRSPAYAVALALTLLAPGVAPAQQGDAAACIAALPESEKHRVLLYLAPGELGGDAAAAQGSADQFTRRVAAQVRRRLSGSPDTAAAVDSLFTVRNLSHHVGVVAHRGRPLVVRVHGPGEWAEWADREPGRSLAALVAAAADSVAAAGGQVEVPATLDSIAFDIDVRWPSIARADAPPLLEARAAFPIATLVIPRTREVAPARRNPGPRYPDVARSAGATGTVIMTFVVRPDGSPDLATARDTWPRGSVRPSGRLATYYEAFRLSVMDALGRMHFVPRRFGTCPVAEQVQMPFVFSLGP